jgi:hypothetical protein
MLANAEWVFAADAEQRAAARLHIATAVEHARRGTGRRASGTLARCLTEMARSADETAHGVRAVDDAAGILLDAGAWRGGRAGSAAVSLLLLRAAELASHEGDRPDEERFRTAGLRCRGEAQTSANDLSNLSAVRRRLGDRHGAVRAATQSLRLAQGLNTSVEGEALLRLAYCALDDGRPADVFAFLAAARIGAGNEQIAGFVEGLRRDFAHVLARLDDPSVADIERDYRADRGASLLREAFDVDVAEIDALNERLGDAGEDDLRGFLLDIKQYCARDEPTA